jgi:hypothetical protein
MPLEAAQEARQGLAVPLRRDGAGAKPPLASAASAAAISACS